MELVKGKMTSRQLAEWFNISYKHYANNRKAKLKELENFCDFKECYGGVEVIEILIPEYTKNIEDDLIYDAEVRKRKNHITSISGIVRDLIAHNDKYKEVPFETLRRRLTKAGIRTYGKTIEADSKGSCGSRKYIWAIKLDDYGHYRIMTQAEKSIYHDIMQKYVSGKQHMLEWEQQALIAKAVRNGEITAEEAIRQQQSYENFYLNVIGPFKDRTGCKLSCATEHEVLESMRELGLLKDELEAEK